MLFRGDFVHFQTLNALQICHDHLLAVDRFGYVSHFADAAEDASHALLSTQPAPEVTLLPRGSFMLPSFCDLHLHAPQFLYQGTGLHLPLMQWLDEYAFKAEEMLDSDPALAQRVYRSLADRLIANGTGAVALFGTIKTDTNILLADIMQQAGLRALVGKLSMDISSRPTYTEHTSEAALVAAISFIERMRSITASLLPHERLVEPVLTPRFVPTCSDALLRGLGEIAARHNVRIQSHLAEARDEVDATLLHRGVSDFEAFDRAGLLTPRTLQAHCTFLTLDEQSRLASRGTAIAHCPLSNAYFSARPLPLREALDREVRVGLGTDVAGGYSADIMSAMRWAVGVAKLREGARSEGLESEAGVGHNTSLRHLDVDWKEAMFLATRGGAEALGLASGVFVVGAPFDAQHIRLFETCPEPRGIGALDFFDLEGAGSAASRALTPEMVEKWWCIGDARNRAGMWVQGRRIGSW
ncbi:Metallo-dependent hydrolase [Auriscalpium vulgare]|uniref:Metallo-dependent hydrolase n=1 Tax=Auriscalpium vulgare TaxID=40419 RepID=A0ACB8S4S2_9AGAM|nr:Metallo-dependent hydrolase [Auriscalpium vulgare]